MVSFGRIYLLEEELHDRITMTVEERLNIQRGKEETDGALD